LTMPRDRPTPPLGGGHGDLGKRGALLAAQLVQDHLILAAIAGVGGALLGGGWSGALVGGFLRGRCGCSLPAPVGFGRAPFAAGVLPFSGAT